MDQHRSIQDIIPPARSKPIRSPMPGTSETPPTRPTPPPIKNVPVNPKRPSGFFGFAVVASIVAVLLVIGVIVISTVFYRAYVTVTPFAFSVPVQGSFESSPTSETLPYQKVSVSDTVSKSVPATGSQHVENHSSGTITIYNAYTTTSQRLITNTRFATADGLVFRVHAPVVIPGYTMKAGVKAPGVVDVVVYADDAGEKYNIPASDFTIPGLKGSKQYTLIYAKSKSAMAGGFIGEQAVVDPTVRSQTVEGLKADLDRSLRAKLISALPLGTLVFNDSVSISYADAPDTVDGSNANISVSGTAVAPAVSEIALARTLANTGQVSFEGNLQIENPNDLHVAVNAPDALGTETPIELNISGTAKLVAVFDIEQLAKDLAGKDKADIKTVLPNYAAISNIDVKIYPFWRGGLPDDPAKLKITSNSSSTN
ncbi:MAG: hypothetical protein V4449_02945 [Patescibacteria group bacterium]